MIIMIYGGLHAFLQVKIWKVIIWKVFFPHMLGWIFFIDAGDFTRLSGEREK